jgi:predicted Holliday junction resolvase-like endonuclease|tara:strand:- start:880 stop:1275 length:396 start_codon:yes stop_codon:yes gene_type:complete
MYQFLFAIILSLSGLCYYIWNENTVLKDNNLKLENAIAEQKETIKSLQADFELQSNSLLEMTLKNQAAERELNRYSEFIRNYKLTAKILEDPIEMQRKINNGTKHIMEDIEKLSGTVDSLDDGLQLQSPSN